MADTELVRLTQLRATLSARVESDSGTLSALASDAAGTTVTFNKSFLDVSDIRVTPKGLTRVAHCHKPDSEYLSKADSAALSTGDITFTFAVWVKLLSKEAAMGLVSKWNTSGNQREYLLKYDQATDKFIFMVSSNGTAETSISAANFPTPPPGLWSLIIVSHDATANTIDIQVNNGAIDSSSYSSGVYDSTAAFNIGAIAGANPANALFGNVGFWKGSLSSAYRQNLYDYGYRVGYSELPAGLLTNLTSFWPLTEESGTREDAHGAEDLTDNNTVRSKVISKSAIVDFTDAPNPTDFAAYIFDDQGIRISSEASWSAEGYL